MKELPVIDNRKRKLILIVLFILFCLMIIFYLINRVNYDLQVSMEVTENDLITLEKRLKSIKINNYKINNLNNDSKILYLKKLSLEKNDLSYSDIEDILLSNHTYEVYLVNKDFSKEIGKYIDSRFTYPIDFKSVLKDPIITGKDIEKVKNIISPNNLNEYYPFTDIKYTEFGKSKNEYISKLSDEEYVIVTLLDDLFWSYGWTYPYSDLYYTSQPNMDMINQFKMVGKDYTYIDIKNIALFSKYNYKNPVKLIEIKDLKKKNKIK